MAIERIVPGTIEWEAFYANHIVRYQFAAQTLSNAAVNNVLDAACGVGYGAHYLAGQSFIKNVIAVDRSREALAQAGKNFSSNNISFLEDDCHTLDAAATKAPYDAVVSFETLEHLPRPVDFLNSCYKNLKPGGTIIISTPNKTVSSPEQLNWEFHEKEYTASELFELMTAAGFTNIRLYGQQFNLKGRIKNEVRGDLNRILSNPFVRAGRWIQQKLRRYKYEPPLKETTDDFEIVQYGKAVDCELKGTDGPFVLIAVAVK